jgi:Tfp pilus assembly protein PilX
MMIMMMKKNKSMRSRKTPVGFAIIASVTVMAVVMLLFAVSLAQGLIGLEQETMILDKNLLAQNAAEACAEEALLGLAQDQRYAGGETFTINGTPCAIQPIGSGTPTVVEVESTAGDSTYRLHIEINDLDAMTISAWQRVDAF